VSGTLFFSGNDGSHGHELWDLPVSAPALAGSDSSSARLLSLPPAAGALKAFPARPAGVAAGVLACGAAAG
jgi:hypothetical protein